MLIDLDDRAYSWGPATNTSANSNSQSENEKSTSPILIASIENKQVMKGAVGDSFAFLLG